jgi:hypothetical protein
MSIKDFYSQCWMIRGWASAGSVLAYFCFVTPAYSGVADQCKKEHAKEKKEIHAEIGRLHKTAPKNLVGPMVPSGQCTIRALMLGITMGTRKDYSNAVDVANRIDCLHVRLYEIDQRCQCREAGLTYDPDAEDEVFSEYKKVRSLEKKLLAAGIPNQAIRGYVKNVSAAKECISRASLQVLKDVHIKLKERDTPDN